MTEWSLIKPLIRGAAADGWLTYKLPASWNPPMQIGGRDDKGRAVACLVRLLAELPVFDPFPWDTFAPKHVKWLMDYAANGATPVVCIYEGCHERMTAYFPTVDSFRRVNTFEVPNIRLLLQGDMFRGWNQHDRI